MLRGLTTVSFTAADVDAAQAWYGMVLGTKAYFVRAIEGRSAYAEFRIGDYQHELGIIDSRFAQSGPNGGAIVYWHVDDVQAAFARLLDLGATEYETPTERGPGFVTASVTDPFGNILGIMFNQHYLDILGSRA